jgi:hypothetical protein
MEMINMFTKQSFQFPDEGKELTTSVREMPSREDHEDIKAIVAKRYEKAHRAVCRNLIASYREKFLLQYGNSLN